MEVSIVIPVKDDIRIKECIDSIDEDVEIVVVLNDASEEVNKIVSKLDVKIVRIDEANLSKAYNAGIMNATYENILLMDSDCVFEKGTIKKLYNGLEHARLSKGMVVFKRKGINSNIVARVREFTTTDFCNAFSPPLAFKKDIINEIGYYFNPKLKWEEDFDFNIRVKKSRLNIYWDKSAKIYHPPLSFRSDLRSAFNYGTGHGVGIKEEIYKTNSISKEQKKKIKRYQKKYLMAKKGILCWLYYKVWGIYYKNGIKHSLKC